MRRARSTNICEKIHRAAAVAAATVRKQKKRSPKRCAVFRALVARKGKGIIVRVVRFERGRDLSDTSIAAMEMERILKGADKIVRITAFAKMIALLACLHPVVASRDVCRACSSKYRDAKANSYDGCKSCSLVRGVTSSC